ncbi:hypothetical protein [Vibrio chagasii]|uniref:hypothetical protein n=1 Tax=Vibrio chagasii TaxID=170679 RepID=UPI00163FB05B|nr:hypothetical protein [Vibrio chagasii]
MKKLSLPDYDDIMLTRQASEDRRMGSYPLLQEQLALVTSAYQEYERMSGNALNIHAIQIPVALASGLKTHYTSEPACFSFIPILRGSSRRVCPMCGSLGTGTLDHLLPQVSYPEFSVFSRNLVPACDCNSKRKDVVSGVDLVTGEPVRVLHPYFDHCLSVRQIYFAINPDPVYPLATFDIVYLNEEDDDYLSVKFHVDSVIIPAGIKEEMEDMWASLVEYPLDKIHTLPEEAVIDIQGLNSALLSALRRHDRQKTTPNNWESIFVYSILNSESAKEWIVQKHNELVGE